MDNFPMMLWMAVHETIKNSSSSSMALPTWRNGSRNIVTQKKYTNNSSIKDEENKNKNPAGRPKSSIAILSKLMYKFNRIWYTTYNIWFSIDEEETGDKKSLLMKTY